MIVEENNLNQSISTLRRVLGERPGEHRYIVTEPGRGYRFVASVRDVPAATDSRRGRYASCVQLRLPESRQTQGPIENGLSRSQRWVSSL